jgi:hypothetical protein
MFGEYIQIAAGMLAGGREKEFCNIQIINHIN